MNRFSLVVALVSIVSVCAASDVVTESLRVFRGMYSVAFSPDGSLLLTGSPDGRVCIWDISDLAVRSGVSSNEWALLK